MALWHVELEYPPEESSNPWARAAILHDMLYDTYSVCYGD